ncbi:MAG: glycoside hydrolase family 5 protein [Candidatus Flexifilum sp.]
MSRVILILVMLSVLSGAALAQPAGLPPRSPVQRCINLGNMLEAPEEGWWGLRVERDYLTTIAEAGFDAVRIPISWSTHAASEPPYTIDPVFFARVDEVVGWALADGLKAIINVHHYEEMMSDPAGHFPRLRALWAQIAEHYADYPPALMFELLNEPFEALTPLRWNEYAADLIALIRQTNPGRTLIVGGGWWNSVEGLMQLRLPDDPDLLATFHYYHPFEFTHQGAEWSPEVTDLSGITWGTGEERLDLESNIRIAAAWAVYNRRPLLLGEFGVYGRVADLDSRLRWTTAVRAEAEAQGIGWCYWEFAAGFGIYDPESRTFNPLYRALIPQAGPARP